MELQIGVNQKMKLYNVYRICKQNIDFWNIINITQKDEVNASNTRNITVYTLNNWLELNRIFDTLSKVPVLKNNVSECVQSIPDLARYEQSPRITTGTYKNLLSKKDILYKKMQVIIELYESMDIENEENGVDIKLPPCKDLKEYISYLKDIDFIFSQCPFLQCEDGILKFTSVDVGSNWLKFTVAAAASSCVILGSVAALVDKAITIRSHYLNVQQQEEVLKKAQKKNELAKEQTEMFNQLRKYYMDEAISSLEKEYGKLKDPEEQDKARRSLEKLIDLLEKGAEFYATLDSPEEIQVLFPQIEDNLSLPDNIVNYIEQKEQKGQ